MCFECRAYELLSRMWLDAWDLDHGDRRELAETFLQGCSLFLAKAMIQAHADASLSWPRKDEMENLVEHYGERFADVVRAAFRDYHQGNGEQVDELLSQVFGGDDPCRDASDVEPSSEKDQMQTE